MLHTVYCFLMPLKFLNWKYYTESVLLRGAVFSVCMFNFLLKCFSGKMYTFLKFSYFLASSVKTMT